MLPLPALMPPRPPSARPRGDKPAVDRRFDWPALRARAARTSLLQGLWRGTVPGLLLTVPYTAVQFVALQQVKDTAARLGWTARDSPWAPAVSFGSGAVAGAAATVASYPFDLLRTTLAAQGEPKVRRVSRWAGLSCGRALPGVRKVPQGQHETNLVTACRLQLPWERASCNREKSPPIILAVCLRGRGCSTTLSAHRGRPHDTSHPRPLTPCFVLRASRCTAPWGRRRAAS
jgi:hypothetical protein